MSSGLGIITLKRYLIYHGVDGGLLRGRGWQCACGSISERPAKEASRQAPRTDRQTEGARPNPAFPVFLAVDGRVRELRTRFGKTRLRILYSADANREFIL